MNKLITLLIIALLSSLTTQAQWWGSSRVKGNGNVITKDLHTSDYDGITVSGAFTVNLVEGKEGDISVKIEDNLLEYLVIETEGETLRIKWEKGVNISTRKGVIVTVPVKDIDHLKLAGSGDIISKYTLDASQFTTSVSGSGDITVKIDANKIKSTITGSGDITISGKTENLKTYVTGSGDFHGDNLEADNVEAKVTGSGDISVIANNYVEARVTGSGDIDFRGNPTKQDTKVTGSGDITSH